MMSADCLASYGSLARFRDQERMAALGETTLMGSSGGISDFQFTLSMLKQYQYMRMYYVEVIHILRLELRNAVTTMDI